MNASNVNMINALVLVGLGMWGVNATGLENSPTPVIPVVVGIILFVCTGFIRNHHKVVSHIAVVLTVLIIIGLARPFMKAMDSGDSMAMLRTGVMIFTSIVATIFFIKSFREARLAKGKR
jgi:NADH:ubiquinone oxidoreductase subunit 2 (subunit N)